MDDVLARHAGEIKSWRMFALLAATCIFSLALAFPLPSDLMVFQWMAIRLHQGALPYVGSWDHNFPGGVIFHIIPILLFGNSELGFRAFESALAILVSFSLYQLFVRWATPRSAFFAVVFYAVFSTHPQGLLLGERDDFAAQMLILSLACWFARPAGRRTFTILISGLLLGIAALIRPPYILIAAPLVVLYRDEVPIRTSLGFLAASITAPIASLIPYLAAGEFHSYYESVILFNLSVYDAYANTIGFFLRRLLHFVPMLLFAAVATLPASTRFLAPVGEAFRVLPRRREKLLLATFLTINLLIILIQRKYLFYHFAPIIAGLAPPAAIGFDRLLRSIPSPRTRGLVAIGASLAIFLIWSPVVLVGDYVVASIREGHSDPKGYNLLLMNGPFTGVQVEDSVLQYLARPENARGPIEVIGYDARLRARFGDRPMATRFSMIQALNVPRPDGSRPDFQLRWRREYIHDLDSIAPRFIVLIWSDAYWKLKGPRAGLPHDFPELDNLIKSRYTSERTYGGYEILRRNTDQSPPATSSQH